MNEWQGMNNTHEIDAKTGFYTLSIQPYNNPFSESLILTASNHFKKPTYRSDINEMKSGTKSKVETKTYGFGSSRIGVDCGDTIHVTMDSFDKKLIIGAKSLFCFFLFLTAARIDCYILL